MVAQAHAQGEISSDRKTGRYYNTLRAMSEANFHRNISSIVSLLFCVRDVLKMKVTVLNPEVKFSLINI